MKKSKAFIYCRVSNRHLQNLLYYQENVLKNLAHSLDMDVIAIAKEVSESKKSYTWEMQTLIHYIRNEKIDTLLIYDKTRIYIFDDLYAEFQMICNQHHVEIITIEDMKKLSSTQLL